MTLTITFMDGSIEVVEISTDEWEALDDRLSNGFIGSWIRIAGEDTAVLYRAASVRSMSV